MYISRKKNLHAARLAHEAISLRLEREAHKAESEEDEKQPEKESSELSKEDYYEHQFLTKVVKLNYELNPRPNPKRKLKPPPDRFEEVRALQRRPKLKKNRPH